MKSIVSITEDVVDGIRGKIYLHVKRMIGMIHFDKLRLDYATTLSVRKLDKQFVYSTR